MSELPPWEVLSSRTVLERKWLTVREDRVRTGAGVLIDEFHVVESPPWAGIICLTEARELVLVEQYRHGHAGLSLELPAGVVEQRENMLEGARRELREETGFLSDDWHALWKLRPEPARHSQWAEFFVARQARRVREQELDATEELRVLTRPISELDQILEQMVHGIHVGALLLAARRGLLD